VWGADEAQRFGSVEKKLVNALQAGVVLGEGGGRCDLGRR
jgi:hypothetical protein